METGLLEVEGSWPDHMFQPDRSQLSRGRPSLLPKGGGCQIFWKQGCSLLGLLRGTWGFPGGAAGKESACQSRRYKRRITELERSHGGRRGNPLQYSCLENSMDRGAWRVTTVHKVAQSQT